MNKKILIGVLVVVVIAIVGGFTLLGSNGFSFHFGGDDFDTNMYNAGDASAEASTIEYEIQKAINDKSKKGIEKNVNSTNELMPLYKKMDVSLNKALNSTDNETKKEYLKSAIKLNEYSENYTKENQLIFKAEQDFENKKISANEYNKKFDSYTASYDKYTENLKKTTKKIKDLLDKNPELIEELKSYGLTGIYIGEFGYYT